MQADSDSSCPPARPIAVNTRSGIAAFAEKCLKVSANPLISPARDRSIYSTLVSPCKGAAKRSKIGAEPLLEGIPYLTPPRHRHTVALSTPRTPRRCISASEILVLAQTEAFAAEDFAVDSEDEEPEKDDGQEGSVTQVEQEGPNDGKFKFGLLLANMSTLMFSLQMLCVKLAAAHGLPSMQLLLCRLVIHTLAVLVCCTLGLFGFHGRVWQFSSSTVLKLCVATGVVNTIVIQLLYFATARLSLALATVLYFTSPFWSAIWKTVLLRDPLSWASAFFGCLSFAAVSLVSLPGTRGVALDVIGILSALLAGALQALAYVIVQMLKRHEEDIGEVKERQVHWLQINLSNAIFGVALTPLALWGPFKMQEPIALSTIPPVAVLEMAGLGAFTVGAQFLLVQSQGYLDVVLVTMVRTLDVMYALSYQSIFFTGTWPTLTSAMGCVLLVSCCSGSAWHARWAALQARKV